MTWQARHGWAGRGRAGFGTAGQARLGEAACIEDLLRVARRANKDASEVIAEMLRVLV